MGATEMRPERSRVPRLTRHAVSFLLVLTAILLLATPAYAVVRVGKAATMSCVKMSDRCPTVNGFKTCPYNVNFTSYMGNSTLTRGLLGPNELDWNEFDGTQECSLYQRVAVCLDSGQEFSFQFEPQSFQKGAAPGSPLPSCTVTDIRVINRAEFGYVLHANAIAPSCMLARQGCDCEHLKSVEWGDYDMTWAGNMTYTIGQMTYTTPYPPQTTCKSKAVRPGYVYFTLSCPLEAEQWVAGTAYMVFRNNTRHCELRNLTDSARSVYACFVLLGAMLVLGFLLLLLQHAAFALARSKTASDYTRYLARSVCASLGSLFDMDGVLHMDSADPRDRWFTVYTMTSVVLTIGLIAFAPKLSSYDSFTFKPPMGQFSELDVRRTLGLINAKNKDVQAVLESLLRPLFILAISACLGLWAYLILLINYTSAPVWTRNGQLRSQNAFTRKMSRKHQDSGASWWQVNSWRVKYIGKKAVSVAALLLLDFVNSMLALVYLSEFQDWRFEWANWFFIASSWLFLTLLHLKFVEVVFIELHDGGSFSWLCCCCCCFPFVKRRFNPTAPMDRAVSSPIADPIQPPPTHTYPTGHTRSHHSPITKGLPSSHAHHLPPHSTPPHPGRNPSQRHPARALDYQTIDEARAVVEPSGKDQQEAPMTFAQRARHLFHIIWQDVSDHQRFQYSAWFLSAACIAVLLAVFYYLQNMERVEDWQECIDLKEPCSDVAFRGWGAVILTSMSALAGAENTESAITRLLSLWLGTKLETAVAVSNFATGQKTFTVTNTSANGTTTASTFTYRDVYDAVRACDKERIETMLVPIAVDAANAAITSNTDPALLASVTQLGIDVPTVLKNVLMDELAVQVNRYCPQLATDYNRTTSGVSVRLDSVEAAATDAVKVVQQVQKSLEQLRVAFRLGGYISSSIGLVVAMVSLWVISQVYRKAIMRMQKERALRGFVVKDSEDTDSAVEMFKLTEEARHAAPLRAVFFYGVIFSSVLIQMQIVTVVLHGTLTLFITPWFWTVIAVRIAAALVTMVVGILISTVVVATLGNNLAPNGRIASPSGWLCYYIIFSCAYIILGIFLALSRLVLVILTSMVYLVRIDRCIVLLSKNLDPGYMSFLGMLRMHFELRSAAVRHQRYAGGGWAKVRRIVFEKQALIRQELRDRQRAGAQADRQQAGAQADGQRGRYGMNQV